MSASSLTVPESDVRPRSRELLPFKVLKTDTGEVGIEWVEEIALMDRVLRQPMQLFERQQISWSRLKGPLLRLMELYHAEAQQVDLLVQQNVELRQRVNELEAERSHEEKSQRGKRNARGGRGDEEV